MIFILCLISYCLIGFITGIVICKIKGKEWCRANDEFDGKWFDNNAQGTIYCSTFFWGFFLGITILAIPFLVVHYIITYIAKKLQE